MKDSIKDKIEKNIQEYKLNKRETTSFTLSKRIIEKLKLESQRLEITNSFLVEMVLSNYFDLPIVGNINEINTEEHKKQN